MGVGTISGLKTSTKTWKFETEHFALLQ